MKTQAGSRILLVTQKEATTMFRANGGFFGFIKQLFGVLIPSGGDNAWDDYKRARMAPSAVAVEDR